MLTCTNVKSIVFFWKLVSKNKNILRLFLCFILLACLAHLAKGNECELLSSLGIHCPLTKSSHGLWPGELQIGKSEARIDCGGHVC
jgi:hypothetical protein